MGVRLEVQDYAESLSLPVRGKFFESYERYRVERKLGAREAFERSRVAGCDNCQALDVLREHKLLGSALVCYECHSSLELSVANASDDHVCAPLRWGWSRSIVATNANELKRAGCGEKQAAVLSSAGAKKAYRTRHPAGLLPEHLWKDPTWD